MNRRLEDRLKAAQGLDDENKIRDLRRKQYDDMEEEINKQGPNSLNKNHTQCKIQKQKN